MMSDRDDPASTQFASLPANRLVLCEDVSRSYGAAPARTVALDRANLAVRPNERVAIVGPSGSGKSTLLHILGAMDRPDSGRALVADHDLSRLTDPEASRFRREVVGFVFQFFNLIPTLSALDNVALPARLAGHAASTARDRARDLLSRVGLTSREKDCPDSLSGGQQQRVAIARSMVNQPRLLLADEPTGALDQKSGEAALELLGELVKERGTTLIMATHSEHAVSTCDRVVRILDGHLVEDA